MLATRPEDCLLIWEQPVSSQIMERVVSHSVIGSYTWYNRKHYTGRCRFTFLTKDAAVALANDLMDPNHTSSYSIGCKNATFRDFPSVLTTISIGGGSVAESQISRWSAVPVLRSDGFGYDVELVMDYDLVSQD